MILVGLLASVLVGLIPAALYSGFVNWLDQHEKEPWWLLLLAFGWGAVPAAAMALIAQVLLDIPTTWVVSADTLTYQLLGGSLWAPITEEVAKGLGPVLVVLALRREVDSVLDGIIYGALAGLGFAFTEDVLYFGASLAEEGWGSWAVVVLLRTIPFGLNHALFTGLTGAGLAAASLAVRPWVRLLAAPAGLLAGIVFHAIHNLGTSLAGLNCWAICFSFVFDWGGVLLLGILVVLIWRQEKAWLLRHLSGEVSAELVQTLTTWHLWQSLRWRALLRGDLSGWRRLGRVRQTATELAFKKERQARGRGDAGLAEEIERQRQRLVELGAAAADWPIEVGTGL